VLTEYPQRPALDEGVRVGYEFLDPAAGHGVATLAEPP
jgi:hypothetical protein